MLKIAGIQGERQIPISAITAIQMKQAGWTPGYIGFSYPGNKPFSSGLIEATQDPDAFVFEKKLNAEIIEFRNRVEALRTSYATNAPVGVAGLAEQLSKLAALEESGALSPEEFTDC